MKRTDLHESPSKRLGGLIKDARGIGERAQTRPTGIQHLGSGDLIWDVAGEQRSVKDLPAAIDVEKLLTEGLATASKKNTVSTSPAPASTEGFPEGGYWTQTASDMTVIGLWQVEDGQWVQRDLTGQDTLTAYPYADIGLLNVAVLAAELITSGYFRTAESGKRIEIDSLGVRAYDDGGQNTININGFDNLMTGGIRTAASGRRTEMLNLIWGSYWSGLRLFPYDTDRPVELKTAAFPWKDYPAGTLYLTSSGSAASRGEVVVAPDRFNLNFEDQATGVQTRYIEVTRGGATAVRTPGTELSLSSNLSYLAMASETGSQERYVEVVKSTTNGSVRSILKSTWSSIELYGNVMRVDAGVVPLEVSSNSTFSIWASRKSSGGGYRFNFTAEDGASPTSAMSLDESGMKVLGSSVVTSPTVTSGSLDNFRNPGRHAVRITTGTPTATWGFCDVVETGNGVIEQRFTTDTGDWREWRRRSTGATTWGPWQVYSPPVSTAGAGMGTSTGWALNTPSIREKNGVIQLTFSVTPNGNAAPGEHVVATINAALNALASIRQQPMPWYAGGNSTLYGNSMWDKNDGRIYLKTTQTLPGGTTCYHTLTFI